MMLYFLFGSKSHKKYIPTVNLKHNWIICDDEILQKAVKLLIHGNCLTLWNYKNYFKPQFSKNSLSVDSLSL